MNKIITRDDVPGRQWYRFMEKVNEFITKGSLTNPITREDVPDDRWAAMYGKINLKAAGKGEDIAITREDCPDGIWFKGLSIINKEIFEVFSPEPEFRNLAVSFAWNKKTFFENIPQDYLRDYPDYDSQKTGLPWLILTFDRDNQYENYKIKMKQNDTDVVFAKSVESIGTLSDSDKVLEVTKARNKYIMFQIIQELQVPSGKNVKFDVTVEYDGIEQTASGIIADIVAPED